MLQLESERLTYREITEQDFEIVAGILRDPEVRRIWEQDFSDEEVWAWIARRQEGYRKSGIDYLLALNKATGQPVGQIGVLREEINGEKVWGVGYILRGDCRKKAMPPKAPAGWPPMPLRNLAPTRLSAISARSTARRWR